jgi:phosphoglycolate phosphatase-like HAD superfamily hydrolase
MFDFDGTVSLLRAGWPEVMQGMMRSVLAEAGESEGDVALAAEIVFSLAGKPTIHQMLRLEEEVRRRGGIAQAAAQYKDRFTSLLQRQIDARLAGLTTGAHRPSDLTIAGTQEFLAAMQSRGIRLYLVSGTERASVVRESAALGLSEFFGSRVYGPQGDDTNFSKSAAVAEILQLEQIAGESLLGIGDGPIETLEVRKVGGLAIGVASDEVGGGAIHAEKRRHLAAAGADLIVPDYREHEKLVAMLGI